MIICQMGPMKAIQKSPFDLFVLGFSYLEKVCYINVLYLINKLLNPEVYSWQNCSLKFKFLESNSKDSIHAGLQPA